jgi:branched-chain amino acid transport system permease protein
MSRLGALVARHPTAGFFVVFALFPFVVPYEALATQVLVYGLFALGFNLVYGYTGLLSFGHAAFFGLGGYGTGIVLARLGVTSLWVGLAAGVVLAAAGGAVIGFLCLRRRGIYFAMLSLAFAQLLYFVGFHLSDVTGGENGLRGIPVLPLHLLGLRVAVDSTLAFYYFVLVVVGLAVAALKRILESPFGAVLQAIRENSDRAAACGYDVTRVKLLSFVFSSAFAGLAGALNTLYLRVVPIDTLYWTTSGQVVMMALLGGAGTFFGPFVGAGVFLVLEDVISVFTESWPLVIGAIFMGFVRFLPRGIWGTVVDRLAVPASVPRAERPDPPPLATAVDAVAVREK